VCHEAQRQFSTCEESQECFSRRRNACRSKLLSCTHLMQSICHSACTHMPDHRDSVWETPKHCGLFRQEESPRSEILCLGAPAVPHSLLAGAAGSCGHQTTVDLMAMLSMTRTIPAPTSDAQGQLITLQHHFSAAVIGPAPCQL